MSEVKQEIQNIEKIVHQILIESKRTRNDDWYLYYCVMSKTNPELINKSFAYVMCEAFDKPVFETVTRARRKLQAKYEELKSNTKTKTTRIERQVEFQEYYRR